MAPFGGELPGAVPSTGIEVPFMGADRLTAGVTLRVFRCRANDPKSYCAVWYLVWHTWAMVTDSMIVVYPEGSVDLLQDLSLIHI